MTPSLVIADLAALPQPTPGPVLRAVPTVRPPPPAPAMRLPMRHDALPAELRPQGRRLVTAGILAAHLLAGWALLQMKSVQQAVVQIAPLMVTLVSPPAPPTPAPPPSPTRTPLPAQAHPVPAPPVLLAPTPTPVPAPAPVVAPEPVAPTVVPVAVVAVPAAPGPPAPPAPPPPPVPAAPKQLPPGAVHYLVQPRMEVPLLSRRLKESGTVHLRIVVDVNGLLKSAVVFKSSGFARLDEQALRDIRSARFAPQTENGQAIEWQTIAPLEYTVD